jgi:hypothetical protein
LTPYWFVSFILKNFYNTAFEEYESEMSYFKQQFQIPTYRQLKPLIPRQNLAIAEALIG